TYVLPIVVVKEQCDNLLGRNWLDELNPNWKSNVLQVTTSTEETLENILDANKAVLARTLGKIKNFEVKLRLKPEAKPKFLRHRSPPYSQRCLIEKELDAQVKEGLLEPVSYSNWASPIVVVEKVDEKGTPTGELRICGDYKATVNPQLEVEQFPLPKVTDLFAKIKQKGCEKFSRLDLRKAYQQMVVHPDDREL